MPKTVYPDAPRVAVGAVVIHNNKVLLILRGKAPAKGTWSLPGGSVNLGETLQAAAQREVLEETGLSVEVGEVVYVFEAIHHDETHRPRYHYVIVDLQATPVDPQQPLSPSDDAADAGWFSLSDIQQAGFPIQPVTLNLLRKLMEAS